MLEIRKHGKYVKTRYLIGCKKCGCEFYFTHGDYKGINGKGVTISCPECGHMWAGKYIGNIAWVGENIDKEEISHA